MNCYPGGIPYRLQAVENPWQLRFSRDTEIGEGGIELAEDTLDSLYEFMEDFAIPLSIDLSTCYWDDEIDMPKKSEEVSDRPEPLGRLLRTRSRYARDLRKLWRGQEVSDVAADVIDRDLARSFYRETVDMDAPLDSPTDISWNEIQIRTAYLRLPEISDQFVSTYDHIRALDHRGTPFPHPIEWIAGSAWLPGLIPGQLNAPVEIRMYRDFGEVVMDVNVYNYAWSPDSPDSSDSSGYADILKGIAALERRGWVRE